MQNLQLKTQTMTSLEIAELTGIRHDNILSKLDKMLVEYKGFKSTPEISGLLKESSYIAKNGKTNRMIVLNKEASLDFVSGENLQVRNAINNRWQELEAKEVLPPLPPLPPVSQTLPSPNDMTSINILADMFNITGVEKVKMVEKAFQHNFPSLIPALPSYSNTKYVGTVGEVSERLAHAYSYHKGVHDLELSAIMFNKILTHMGFVKTSYTSSGRSFKVVIGDGFKYGKNVCPKESSSSTQIHWYDDSILELYDLVTG